MRLGSFRSAGEQALAQMAANSSRRLAIPRRDRFPRYLYFLQGVGTDGVALDMPDNTKDFEEIILDGKHILSQIHIFSTAGTWTVQLKYDGAVTGEQYTSVMTYPRAVRPSLLVAPNKRLTLRLITKSTSPVVAGFVARLKLYEV